MGAYILSIAGVILISAVISIIAPSGKMGKFVKGMTRLFIFVVLVAPFVKLVKEPETVLTGAEIGVDEGYLDAYSSMLSRTEAEDIAAYLKEKYGVRAKVEVRRLPEDLSYEKITVCVTDFGINGEETHIDILSSIAECLYARYGCMTEVR